METAASIAALFMAAAIGSGLRNRDSFRWPLGGGAWVSVMLGGGGLLFLGYSVMASRGGSPDVAGDDPSTGWTWSSVPTSASTNPKSGHEVGFKVTVIQSLSRGRGEASTGTIYKPTPGTPSPRFLPPEALRPRPADDADFEFFDDDEDLDEAPGSMTAEAEPMTADAEGLAVAAAPDDADDSPPTRVASKQRRNKPVSVAPAGRRSGSGPRATPPPRRRPVDDGVVASTEVASPAQPPARRPARLSDDLDDLASRLLDGTGEVRRPVPVADGAVRRPAVARPGGARSSAFTAPEARRSVAPRAAEANDDAE